MKNKTLALLLFAFLFQQCQLLDKQEKMTFEVPSELSSDEGRLLDFIQKYQTIAQKYVLKNNEKQTFTGSNGTKITINAADLETLDGKPISSDIEIEIKEAFTVPEFILYGLHTVSDGRLLKSGGMVYTNATANGQQLKIKDGKNIILQLPNANESDMKLFYADFDCQIETCKSLNWVATNQVFEMRERPTADDLLSNSNDTTRINGHFHINDEALNKFEAYYQAVFLNKFGWTNCDKFYGYKGLLAAPTYKIKLSEKLKIAHVYALFQDNSLIKSQVYFYKDGIYSEPIGSVPSHLTMKLLAIGYQDNKIYCATTHHDKSSNFKNINLDMKEVSQPEFEAMLRDVVKW